MTSICIAGSRHWYGADCIAPLYRILKGDSSTFENPTNDFLVGDAVGIDTWATFLLQDFAGHIGCRGVCVYHVGTRPRNHLCLRSRTSTYRVNIPDHTAMPVYTFRDNYMIERCEQYIAFWNGNAESRGTLAGYEYACLHSKVARLYRWDGDRQDFVLHMSSGVKV